MAMKCINILHTCGEEETMVLDDGDITQEQLRYCFGMQLEEELIKYVISELSKTRGYPLEFHIQADGIRSTLIRVNDENDNSWMSDCK